jgi:hypothetical protein
MRGLLRKLLCWLEEHEWKWADGDDVRAGLKCKHCGRNGHSFF